MSAAKILVIEDNPADVYVLRRILLEHGEDFELEVAPDGARALEFVREVREVRERQHDVQDIVPCVILLDLHLPKHDGLEVLRAINQEPVLGHVHVMLMTNIVNPSEEAELQKLGAAYRLKPRNLAEFAELATEVIAICKGLQVAR